MREVSVNQIMINSAHMYLTFMTNWKNGDASDQFLEHRHDGILDQLAILVKSAPVDRDELMDLGFKRWMEEDDEENEILLIPLWIYKLMSVGTPIFAIDGEESYVGDPKIDLDTRFGCLAWGIKVKEGEKFAI